MGIKLNEKTGLYDITCHKRHPITRSPYKAARTGIKSKAEANRVFTELVIQVEQKLHEKIVPKWITLVDEYRRVAVEKDMTFKTVENYYVCLKAHTFEAWGNRFVDSITRTRSEP